MNTSAEELEHQANLLRNNGKGYESIPLYEQAKQAWLESGNPAKAAGCQHMIGVSYKIENDLDKAMPAYKMAIDDYNKAGDKVGPGRVERDIGVMYEYHDRLEEAEKHLFESKRLLGTAGDRAELGITLSKIGALRIRQGRDKDAARSLLEGLALVRKAGQIDYEITTLMHLAVLFWTTRHYEAMLLNLEAALGVIYENNLQDEHGRRLAQIWGGMAHAHNQLGNQTSAKHFAKKSLNFIDKLSKSAQKPLLKNVQADKLRALI